MKNSAGDFAVFSVRGVDYDGGNVEAYIERERKYTSRKIHVNAIEVEKGEVELREGQKGIRVEWEVEYYLDVSYDVDLKGIWSSVWVGTKVSDDRIVVMEALIFGNARDGACLDDRCLELKAQLEAALLTLKAYEPIP